jgi:hypothetical protein
VKEQSRGKSRIKESKKIKESTGFRLGGGWWSQLSHVTFWGSSSSVAFLWARSPGAAGSSSGASGNVF